jgi:hypothetical protein
MLDLQIKARFDLKTRTQSLLSMLRATGIDGTTTTLGESVRAFVPRPLPPG